MRKNYYLFFIALLANLILSVNANGQCVELETDGIRQVISGSVDGQSVIYVSEIDGTLSLNTTKGKQFWRIPSERPSVTFRITTADINGDKSDDVLAASSNGAVYCYSSKGNLLWEFRPQLKVRFSQVAVVGKGDKLKIFAAGNNFILYELNRDGEVLSETAIKGAAHTLLSGNFMDKDKECLFLFTLNHDKLNSAFVGFINPDTKKVISKSDINKMCPVSQIMVNDISVVDTNKDGVSELLIAGHSKAFLGYMFVVDSSYKTLLNIKSPAGKQLYAHSFARSLQPLRDEIVMQYGGVLSSYDLKGNLLQKSGKTCGSVIYNHLHCIPSEKILLGCGQVGGDNTLYLYDLTKKKWAVEHEFQGRFAQVEKNIETLYNQAINFKVPSYQKNEKNNFTVVGMSEDDLTKEVAKLNGGDITFLSSGGNFSENTSRDDLVAAIGEDALLLDRRRKYTNTREEIIEWARAKEKAGDDFQIWVGHGTDPFFIRIETIEKMIEVAPTTCKGLIYAEMDNTLDPRVKYFVDEYIPRLANVIRKYNAPTKVYFRYKQMFWAADCHEPIWKEAFFSEKYSDILVPSAEDTNNRLQDLNFAGRVGMYASGYVDNFAIRLINDNPTSWRPFSPGGQRSVSPYLRNAALLAAYGSSHGVLGRIVYLDKEMGYNPFYALIKSGLLPKVNPEDILSINSWLLIDDVNEEYLRRSNDGHNLANYNVEDGDAVVGYSGVHWCGTDISDYDYSKVASGCDYRWLNFIPSMPNGLVAITDIDYRSELDKRKENYLVTDIKDWIVDGKKVKAEDYGSEFKSKIEANAKSLLMTIDGASWGLFRLSDRYARLVLIDPGYIDPADCEVTINLNTLPRSVTDILSGEKLKVKGGKINLTVPAGSMRFIDFEYEKEIMK